MKPNKIINIFQRDGEWVLRGLSNICGEDSTSGVTLLYDNNLCRGVEVVRRSLPSPLLISPSFPFCLFGDVRTNTCPFLMSQTRVLLRSSGCVAMAFVRSWNSAQGWKGGEGNCLVISSCSNSACLCKCGLKMDFNSWRQRGV